MSDAIPAMQSTERLLSQAIATLVPFFMTGPTSNVQDAHLAAKGMLDSQNAVTPKELQLATQVIAFSMTVLACLGAAAASKNLSIDEMLDWQDSAIALNRQCTKDTKALEARQKERTKNPAALTLEKTRWDKGAFQLAIGRALEKMTKANAKVAVFIASFAPAVPVVPAPKLPFLSAEQMTPSVLARRARN